MKTLLLLTLIMITGYGGYNVQDDGILGAPLGTMLYWGFGADKASSTGGTNAKTVNVNVIDWSRR